MAIARPNAASAQAALARATRRISRADPDAGPADGQPRPGNDAAADFAEWAKDVGVVALGGSAVDGAGETTSDGAAIRLAFQARQDFKAAFLDCLTTGATVVEHPKLADNGDLSVKLRDPDGHLWDLTVTS